MVQLTVTPAAKAAIEEYCRLREANCILIDAENVTNLEALKKANLGSPIDHHELIKVSRCLVQHHRDVFGQDSRETHLDALLNGTTVYHPPLPPKPEPTPEYKALMQRLREQEEQRQYERMTNTNLKSETFEQRFPIAPKSFDPNTSHGQGPSANDPDDVTYADVNRQIILIINVLVSIVASSVTIWFAARRWDVPQRLGLSLTGSGIIALAEVAIYLGYIQRIKDAKNRELQKVERKEIVETWVIDNSQLSILSPAEAIRNRKGKHR